MELKNVKFFHTIFRIFELFERKEKGISITNLSNSLISSGTATDEAVYSIRSASEGARTSNTPSAHLNSSVIVPQHPRPITSLKLTTHLNTNLQIIVELVTIRAAAFVAANRVDASAVSARGRVAFVLVETLIVIKMLNESFGTSATIASHKILQTTQSKLQQSCLHLAL